MFGVTQAEFAALAGVTQGTVSRWEAGVAPSLDDMRAIREAALARGIDWNDGWFFEVPGDAVAAEAVGEPQRPAAGNPHDFDAATPRRPASRPVPTPPKPGPAFPISEIQEMAE
jgi:transcriptional regulator with XRE-family HTH domain